MVFYGLKVENMVIKSLTFYDAVRLKVFAVKLLRVGRQIQ